MISRFRARNPLKPTGTPEEQVTQGPRYTVDTIEAAGRGDAAAFMILYYAKGRAVDAYIAPAVGEDHIRELRLRQVFLSAWRELPSLDRAEAFDLWLLRLAHEAISDQHADAVTPQAASSTTIGELYSLPRRLREVLALRYFFTLSPEQIALALESTVDEVEDWQRQGLETLAATAAPQRQRFSRAA